MVDTPLLTNLIDHPSSLVHRCEVPAYTSISLCFVLFTIFCTDILFSDFVQDPPESVGRGGWSDFSQLLDVAREYREFFYGAGFWPLPQHPIRARVPSIGEVLGGEVLLPYGDLPS